MLLRRPSHKQDGFKLSGKSVRAYTPHYPMPRDESWYFFLTDPGNNAVIAWDKVSLGWVWCSHADEDKHVFPRRNANQRIEFGIVTALVNNFVSVLCCTTSDLHVSSWFPGQVRLHRSTEGYLNKVNQEEHDRIRMLAWTKKRLEVDGARVSVFQK